MKKMLTADEWVRRLNQLAAEMAEYEHMLHPSAWSEQMADLRAEYVELAKQPTYDPPIQMEMEL